MLRCFKLPLVFVPSGLKADLAQIQPGEWTPHFNTGYFDGDWSGVALIAAGGHSAQLYSDPAAKEPSRETAIGARCPHLREALATFECPLKSVRLLKLGTGAYIREHCDYDLGPETGEVRIHVPIVTNPDVDFVVDGMRLDMHEGECWYLDLSLPHRVHNGGTTDRIHLVLDCMVNEWLKSLIPFGDPDAAKGGNPEHPSDAASSMQRARLPAGQEAFERFRQWVLDDPTLQERLRGTADLGSFIALVVALGTERGCMFNPADVDAALQAARRTLVEKWI